MDENLVKNIQCYAANLLFQIMFFGLLIASVEPAVRRDRVSGSNTKTYEYTECVRQRAVTLLLLLSHHKYQVNCNC